MKCPSCGYNSFDYLETCKKCGSPLGGDSDYKSTDRDVEADTGERPEYRSGGGSEELFEELLDIPITPAGEKHLYNDESSFVEKITVAGHETGARIESSERREASKESRKNPLVGEGTQDHSLNTAPKEISPYGEEQVPKAISDPFLTDEDSEGYGKDNLEKSRENYKLEPQVFNLAGFVTRGVAFIVDIIIITLTTVVSMGVGLYFAGGFDGEVYGSDKALIPLYLVLFILVSTYFIFLHGLTGTTIGKMLAGIKLINNEGDKIGLWDSFVRWVGYYISAAFLFVGFLWSLFDAESQTWHDKIAGTYVVKD